tara:strand:- start:321 stop:569 length:249 start_codon:yes stop_codon:yes gene_type:complete
MTPVEREYQIFKAKQNQQSDDDRKRNRDIVNGNVMRKGITTDKRIPNMKDAYTSVINSNHVQTEQEKDFLRFTSGSYVDRNK